MNTVTPNLARHAYDEAMTAYYAMVDAENTVAEMTPGTEGYADAVEAYRAASLKARIKLATANALNGTDNAVEMTVSPPQGWDNAEA